MKISQITLHNFRAFHGSESIKTDDKNLLIYGENGSGKSSLYAALRDFCAASVGPRDIEANIFDATDAAVSIQLSDGSTYRYSGNSIDRRNAIFEDTHKYNPFFTYKRLLRMYVSKKDENKPDLFDLLINTVLPHHINSETGRTFGKDWEVINEVWDKRTKEYDILKDELLDNFNNGLNGFLSELADKVNTFLNDHFEHNIEIAFAPIKVDKEGREISGNDLELSVKFFGQPLVGKRYDMFLNEARLSALALCMYLASLKIVFIPPQFKILVLDDIFIGLDMGNRLPLLKILQEEFKEYQIFMTTYDRNWFEVAKKHLGEKHWKTIEMYVGKQGAFDVPVVIDPSENYLQKATKYYETKDYPACSNYLRKEIEKLIKDRLPEEVIRIFEGKPHTLTYLWGKFVSRYSGLGVTVSEDVKKSLETSLLTLLNPQSHHGLNFPVYEKELSETFKLVDKIAAYPIIQSYVVLHEGVHLKFTHPTEKYTFECIVTSAWTLATKPGGSSMTFPNCRITIWQFEGKEFWDFPNKQIFKNIGNITSSESRLNKILYNLTQISELSINEDMFKKYTLCDGTYTLEKVMKKHKVSLLRKS